MIKAMASLAAQARQPVSRRRAATREANETRGSGPPDADGRRSPSFRTGERGPLAAPGEPGGAEPDEVLRFLLRMKVLGGIEPGKSSGINAKTQRCKGVTTSAGGSCHLVGNSAHRVFASPFFSPLRLRVLASWR